MDEFDFPDQPEYRRDRPAAHATYVNLLNKAARSDWETFQQRAKDVGEVVEHPGFKFLMSLLRTRRDAALVGQVHHKGGVPVYEDLTRTLGEVAGIEQAMQLPESVGLVAAKVEQETLALAEQEAESHG